MRRERAGFSVCRACLAATVVLASLAVGVAARAQTPSTIDDLMRLFRVGEVPADFVIVIDTSGSMSSGEDPPYPGVVEAYKVLIDTIPDGDFVSVITFDTEPDLRFRDTLDSSNRSRAKLVLPEKAEGKHTDIGKAIDATLDRLGRADANEIQTVVFMTDGKHDPPDGSPYPTTHGPAWKALKDRARELEATHDITVLGIGLAEGTDVGLLRTVFTDVEINSLPPDQLPGFFEEAVQRSRLARLRRLVERELADGGVRLRSSTTTELQHSISAEVDVTSTFQKLPVRLTISKVRVTDREGNPVLARLEGPESVVLQPGETASIPIEIRPDLAPERVVVPPVTETAEFLVALDATYEVQPSDTLALVTPASLTGTVEGTAFVNASRTYGWSVAKALTLAAIALPRFWCSGCSTEGSCACLRSWVCSSSRNPAPMVRTSWSGSGESG